MFTKFIIMCTLLMCYLSFESYSQYGTPFDSCYQNTFNECVPGCGPESEISKNFLYNGCEVEVTYKIRHCECPTPTTFIQINYIRINISEPEECCDLICYLFPPGPFPKNCDPNHHNLNCYNNPPNGARLFDLTEDLYDMLSDTIFHDVQAQYICPNKLTVKHFWPGKCSGLCIYSLQKYGPAGGDRAYAIVPSVCETGFCCSVTMTYCNDLLGQTHKTVTTTSGDLFCGEEAQAQCKSINDVFNLDGVDYQIVSVSSTECYAPCSIEE